MKQNIYRLWIDVKQNELIQDLNRILGFTSFSNDFTWRFEIIEGPKDPYQYVLERFANILEKKIDEILALGINHYDITIWHIIKYDTECNTELDPLFMKTLGDIGVKFCISAYLGSFDT